MSEIYIKIEEEDGSARAIAIEDAHSFKELLDEPKVINFALKILDEWRRKDNYDR